MRLPSGYGSVIKMSGRRRRPWMVRKTAGWHYDPEKDKQVQDYIIIGYAKTKAEGLAMLADYNANPYDIKAARMTFEEVYQAFSKWKYSTVSKQSIHLYESSYRACAELHPRIFADLRLADLQGFIDRCGKNYPTLSRLKVLFHQMYIYAMKYEICSKDYSEFIDISQYRDRNPNRRKRDRIAAEDLDMLWLCKDEPYCQTILMLIYNGCRVSEFLDLKKEDVHLDKQYFDVVSSKTPSGIRQVPIADKVLPFYEMWYNKFPDCEYLLSTRQGKHLTYSTYMSTYFRPAMDELGMNYTPHFTRHTTTSMMADAGIDLTIQKKILGHVSKMSLTEKVYTHMDIKTLITAINKI